MSFIQKKLEKIRSKPQHVRERILLLAMAIIVPAIVTIWYGTVHFKSATAGSSIVKSIGDTFNKTSNDANYKETFGNQKMPSFSTGAKK